MQQSSSTHNIATTCYCVIACATQFFKKALEPHGVHPECHLKEHLSITYPPRQQQERTATTTKLLQGSVPLFGVLKNKQGAVRQGGMVLRNSDAVSMCILFSGGLAL